MTDITWTPETIALLKAAVGAMPADEPDDSALVLILPSRPALPPAPPQASPTSLGVLPDTVVQPGPLPMTPPPRGKRLTFQLGYARRRLAELTAA